MNRVKSEVKSIVRVGTRDLGLQRARAVGTSTSTPDGVANVNIRDIHNSQLLLEY